MAVFVYSVSADTDVANGAGFVVPGLLRQELIDASVVPDVDGDGLVDVDGDVLTLTTIGDPGNAAVLAVVNAHDGVEPAGSDPDEGITQAQVGVPDGVAALDSGGAVPSAQLPSTVQLTTEKDALGGYVGIDGLGDVDIPNDISVAGDITTLGTVDGRDIAADGFKLDGVESGATANSTDATLLDRANHTGTQAASTVTGLAAVATTGAFSDLTGSPASLPPSGAASGDLGGSYPSPTVVALSPSSGGLTLGSFTDGEFLTVSGTTITTASISVTGFQPTSEKDQLGGYLGIALSGDVVIPNTLDVTTDITVGGTVDGRDVAADGTKLDGIESGATSDQVITAGGGLTGGGTGDVTLDVAANADGSIVVNADDIQVGVLASDAQHGTRGGGPLHADATTSVSGFLSSSDKTKLDGIASGATANQTDAFLLDRANHTGTQAAATITGLATVATTGDYADLVNVPATFTPSDHAVTHVSGGTDEIDGDRVDIDYVPTNYTQSTTPPQVTLAAELTAHLAGIDNALSGLGTGNVVGPGSATDNAIARFDTTTGQLIQNSVVLIDDAGNVLGVANLTLSGTVDGRDVAADGTKLDGVAAGATANQTDAFLLDRANHTGTQAASTITGLATVATTGAFSDLTGAPTSLPPDGAAGGDLGGSYPNPSVEAVTTGVTQLTIGTLNDGELLVRSGTSLVSIAQASVGVTDHGALTGLADDDHPQYQLRTEKDALNGYVGIDGVGNVTVTGSASAGSFSTAGNITVGGTVDGRDLAADGTKLDGIASGATANQTDAFLLNRANHTGTQAASTITGLATVATSGAFSDLTGAPTSLPPNGPAGGDLNGTYPNPTVEGFTESSGPTNLIIGAIADGELLIRSGSDLVSIAPASVGVTDHGALIGLADDDHPQYQLRTEKDAANGYLGIDASDNVNVVGNITVGGTVDGRDLAADGTKLDGIASGATANQTDAFLLDRANHTGTQAATTITGLSTVATTGEYGDLQNIPTAFPPSAHAGTHVRGGTDAIDADTLDISFVPTNYTPSTTPAEVTVANELTAHLAGIDDSLQEADLDGIEVYDAAGGTTLPSGNAFGFAVFDTLRFTTAAFTFTPTSTVVTCARDGKYDIWARVTTRITTSGTRTTNESRLVVNGSFVAGSLSRSYHRSSADGSDTAVLFATVDLVQGDTVGVQCRTLDNNNGPDFEFVAESTALKINGRQAIGPSTGGSGVTDHGALTGLSDNDHPQYLLVASAATVATSGSYNDLIDTPSSLPPSGAAGGDLSGTYPNPAVASLTETSGPTQLVLGAIADGELLTRSGSTITSTSISSPVTDHGALTGLADDDHPQYQLRTEKDAANGYVGLDASSNAVVTGSVTVGSLITSGTVDGRDVSVDGTKLDGIAPGATANSTDATLLDRANHTGTQAASTVTGLVAVATSGAFSDLTGAPTSLPPSGPAGGDLSGTYPNPSVSALTETSGPSSLTLGALPDGQYLIRRGTTIVAESLTVTQDFDAIDLRSTRASDWPVNVVAPVIQDPDSNALLARAFDDSVDEGVGVRAFFIPVGLSTLTLRLLLRTRSGVGGDVALQFYARAIPDGSPPPATFNALASPSVQTIPAGTGYTYLDFNLPVASLGFTPGLVNQFQIARIPGTAGDTLAGDLLLSSVVFTFSL